LPRIRYRRDYDWTPNFRSSEDFGESDDRLSEEDESVSGNSWLSNAAIAAQLSEARIKTAIKSLKAQITVLEAELLSRRLMGGNKTHKDWDNIGDGYPKENGKRYAASSPKRRNSKNSQFSQIRKTLKKLGVKDVNALLDEWNKMMKG